VITIGPEWMTQLTVVVMLVSLRLLGFFMVMPLFAMRAVSMRFRVVLSLVMAFGLLPLLPLMNSQSLTPEVMQASAVFAMLELALGMTAGFVVRIGFMAVEFLAEVLSIQSGLSFAANTIRDPVLQSGLMGELLGMVSLAIAFLMNVHLLALDLLLRSFWILPFGTFPSAWRFWPLLELMQQAFVLGVVLSMPTFVVYFFFNLTQAMMSRVSPQMNLFSVGFAISVPTAFVVLALLLPAFPEVVQRALEAPVALLRQGLGAR
jgi:flagellar biosynthetic protein FliR